jgi:hypothetical protein
METLLSFPPPTSCAPCSWIFQATPKSHQLIRFSGQPRLVVRLVDEAAGQAEARRDLNVSTYCSQSPSSLCSKICAGAPW